MSGSAGHTKTSSFILTNRFHLFVPFLSTRWCVHTPVPFYSSPPSAHPFSAPKFQISVRNLLLWELLNTHVLHTYEPGNNSIHPCWGGLRYFEKKTRRGRSVLGGSRARNTPTYTNTYSIDSGSGTKPCFCTPPNEGHQRSKINKLASPFRILNPACCACWSGTVSTPAKEINGTLGRLADTRFSLLGAGVRAGNHRVLWRTRAAEWVV